MNLKYYLGPYVFDHQIARQLGLRAFVAPHGTVAAIDLRSEFERNETLGGCGIFATRENLPSEYRLFGQGDIREIYPRESERAIFAGLLNMRWVAGDSLADWLWSALTVYADETGEERVKPLMPTTGRQVNLHLGQTIRSQRWDVTRTEFQTSHRLMQLQYQRARNETREGRYYDELHHRRVLDYWGHKLGYDRPQDILIPRGLPIETPVMHATSVSDNFNRANEALNAGPWAEITASLGVVSNTVQRDDNLGSLAYGRHTTALSSDDHYAEVVVSKHDIVDAYAGAAVRFHSGNGSAYFGWSRKKNGEGYELWSFTGGTTLTRLALTGNPPATPFTLRLEANGTDLKLFDPAISAVTPRVTATAVEGNLHVGLVVSGQLTSGSQGIDSFAGADLSTVATSITASAAATGTVGVALTVTFTPDGTPSVSTVVTPTSDKAGTWSTTTLTFTTSTPQTSDFTPSATGVHTLNSTDDQALTNVSDSVTISAAAATATTLSGPPSGTVGVASQNFTVGFNGTPPAGDTVITPSASAGTGTFAPTTLTLNAATPTGTFTFAKGEAGTVTINIADDRGLNDAPGVSYIASAAGSAKFFRNALMSGGLIT